MRLNNCGVKALRAAFPSGVKQPFTYDVSVRAQAKEQAKTKWRG